MSETLNRWLHHWQADVIGREHGLSDSSSVLRWHVGSVETASGFLLSASLALSIVSSLSCVLVQYGGIREMAHTTKSGNWAWFSALWRAYLT